MTRLSLQTISSPLARSFSISRGSKTSAETVLVTIERGGQRGRGECVPYSRYDETVDTVVEQIEAMRAGIEGGLDRAALQDAMPAGAARCAVDCALWDLKGKAWGQPIWRLLGGPTRDSVPAYASMLGHSIEPATAATKASEYQAKGYTAQKWFFRYGPAHGAEGFANNMAMATAVRTAVGPQYKLMFDAFMGWDRNYATKMVQALQPLDPTWMEEPIPPERVGEFRVVREDERRLAKLDVGPGARVLAAEVAERVGAVRVEEHVGRLEIEMEHGKLALMEVEDAKRDLPLQAHRVLHPELGRLPTVQQLVERGGAELEED